MQKNFRFLILIAIVVAMAIYAVWPNNPGVFGKVIETRLGLDLVGGVQALLEADLPTDQSPDSEAMKTAVRIVENRVNGLGVTEAVVQQAGDRRIVVELPGETDPEKALATLRSTGLLEFVDFSELSAEEIQAMMAADMPIQTNIPVSGQAAPAAEDPSGTPPRVFNTIMTGAALKTAAPDIDPMSGQNVVAFELQSDYTALFRDFTSQHVGKVIAIVLDKHIISAPSVSVPITDGKGIITGDFTAESANALAVQLRYGSLPIPLKVVETRTIGPTLGQDSLQKSMLAGIIGFTIVVLFMGLYYRLPGLVAIVAILIYALVAFALFRFIPITLTLPGIAGFLLSTGSALDANILIFERLKEELRAGKTLRQAVDLGWRRAWPSIRDSNIATLITCVILFFFGSQFGATIVKGFSLTLALGVFVSLFTAIVVTRALLTTILERAESADKVRWFGI